MNETITLQEAKELYQLCEKKGVEMKNCKLKWFYGEGYEDKAEKWRDTLSYSDTPYCDWLLPRYTTNELLDWLPASTSLIKKTNIKNNNEVRYYAETFEWHPETFEDNPWGIYSPTPQSALVKLLMELIKKDLIK